VKKAKKKFRIDWTDNAVSKPKSLKVEKPLREYRIKFEKVSAGAKAIPDPNKLGIRSKLGGKPDWVQHPAVPICPECEQAMSFVGQIDSMEHDEPHNPHAVGCMSGKQEYLFGDVGMIYVFLCFGCTETKSIVQYG